MLSDVKLITFYFASWLAYKNISAHTICTLCLKAWNVVFTFLSSQWHVRMTHQASHYECQPNCKVKMLPATKAIPTVSMNLHLRLLPYIHIVHCRYMARHCTWAEVTKVFKTYEPQKVQYREAITIWDMPWHTVHSKWYVKCSTKPWAVLKQLTCQRLRQSARRCTASTRLPHTFTNKIWSHVQKY